MSTFDPTHPVFSVVIPVYDRTKELIAAIESVLAQRFRNFELLLVCDGSPPATADIVKKYADHPQVRTYFYPDNSGNACRGRNKAIAMAKGDYIAFLDSDDIAMPHRLEATYFHICLSNADLVYGGVRIIADGSRQVGWLFDGQVVLPVPATLEEMKKSNPMFTCAVAVRTACLKKFGAFRKEMRYREDHELWLRLAYNGCRFREVKEVFSRYRVHEKNAELQFKEDDAQWIKMMLSLFDKK